MSRIRVLLLFLLCLAPAVADEAEIRLYDRIYMKGNPDPVEGKIVEETPEGIRFQRRGSTVPYIISRGDIDRIERAESPERIYLQRAGGVAPGDARGHLDLARFCLGHGLDRHAETEARRAVEADPRAVEGWRLLADVIRTRYAKLAPEVHADVRDRELDVYERAKGALGELPANLALARARLLRELGAREAALAELGRFTAGGAPLEDPGLDREVRIELGDLALEMGRPADAERAYAAAVAADPGDARALTGLGLALFARGDVAAAGAAFEKAIAAGRVSASEGAGTGERGRSPSERVGASGSGATWAPDPLALRLACAVHELDLATAEAVYAKLAGGPAPGAPGAEGRPGETDGAGDRSGGAAGGASKVPAEAALHGALAAALAGRVALARERLALARGAPEEMLVAGFVAEVEGDAGGAIAAYAAAAERGAPASEGAGTGERAGRGERVGASGSAAAGLAALARAQVFLDKHERGGDPEALRAAEDALRESARRGHDVVEVARLLARARRRAGDHRGAARFARHAAEAGRPDPDVHYALGLAYLGFDAADEAEAAFDAALAAAPDHPAALCGKARVLYGRGEYRVAEELFERVARAGMFAARADAATAYAGLALRRLEEARSRRVWRDDFERADTKDVRNRWVEDERFGIEAAVRGKKLVLSGVQASEDWGRTEVIREVEGAAFAELRAKLDFSWLSAAGGREPQRAPTAGIRLATRDVEVVFFRGPGGGLAYKVHAGAKWSDPVEVSARARGDAGPEEYWIALGGPARDEVVLGEGEAELARKKLPALAKATGFSCAIWCEAPIGAPVEVSCDDARVFIFREGKAKKGGGR